jgi:hypothetical protein
MAVGGRAAVPDTRRQIEQIDLSPPDLVVPFERDLIVDNPSLLYHRKYVPEIIRLGTDGGSIAVQFWFKVDYPWPEGIIRQIVRQLPTVGLPIPLSGIDGLFVELCTSTWYTRFNPHELQLTISQGAVERDDLATFPE